MSAQHVIEGLLEPADIQIGGRRSWDIHVHNADLYKRVLRQGTLGLGEAYMDGWWDCDALDELFFRALRAKLDQQFSNSIPAILNRAVYMLFNLQTVRRASMVAERHYNFDNQLFEYMLGPTMNYSCGYWTGANTLDEAQFSKMDMICRKLQLDPGMSVLDIGCGWGGLARYMHEKYNVDVTGVTVSEQQYQYAISQPGGLDINWLLKDYRSISGQYDRIVSVGMFEHVGRKNYSEFIAKVREVLKPDGLFLLHTIGSNAHREGVDPWIEKYIFPNGILPSLQSIAEAAPGCCIMEDWHNFGVDYDKTLMMWAQRFEEGYSMNVFTCEPRIRRMFRYYLLSCAGAFRARDLQLWQIVFSPNGVSEGYRYRDDIFSKPWRNRCLSCQ